MGDERTLACFFFFSLGLLSGASVLMASLQGRRRGRRRRSPHGPQQEEEEGNEEEALRWGRGREDTERRGEKRRSM